MLDHEVFRTEVVPSFKDDANIALVVLTPKGREGRGSVNVNEVAPEFLPLIAPIIQRTINNEQVRIRKIEGNLNSFIDDNKLVESNKTSMLGQYQRTIINKNNKIKILAELLIKISARIKKADKEELAIKNILVKK